MVRRRIVPQSFYRADGKPKPRYESEVAPGRGRPLGMTYYRCDFCNRFHLASKSSSLGW